MNDLKKLAQSIRIFDSVCQENLSPVERGIIKLAIHIIEDMAKTERISTTGEEGAA